MGGKSRKIGGISKELVTRIKNAPELKKSAKPEQEKTQPKLYAGLLFGEDE